MTTAYPRTFPVAGPLSLSVRLGAGECVITATDVDRAVVDLQPMTEGDAAALAAKFTVVSQKEFRGELTLTVNRAQFHDIAGFLRGRAPGEVAQVLGDELRRRGLRDDQLRICLPELGAVRAQRQCRHEPGAVHDSARRDDGDVDGSDDLRLDALPSCL